MPHLLHIIKNYILLKDYKESLAPNDLVGKHRLKVFQTVSVFYLLLYLSFAIFYKEAFWSSKLYYYIFHILFITVIANYLIFNKKKKSQFAYGYSVVLFFILLHMNHYVSGGIQNSGNAYYLCIILYSYILLGKKYGLISTIVSIANLLYFYLITEYTNLIDFSILQNDVQLIRFDYLLTFVLSILFIWTQANFLQKTHREIVDDIKNSNEKLLANESEKLQLNQRILENELKALRAQMNPHFTYNVMNSVQYYLNHQQVDLAQQYLTKFSTLMRKVLHNSKANLVPLADEIEALQIYVELEQMRFSHSFTFSITTATSVSTHTWYVPSMLLQPFVENSIKHGFATNSTGAHISIDIVPCTATSFTCTITDNGIGRQKAMALKSTNLYSNAHKSYGIQITEERLKILNTQYSSNASLQIIDNEINGGVGTTVILELPIIED